MRNYQRNEAKGLKGLKWLKSKILGIFFKSNQERPINRPPYQYWYKKQFIHLIILFFLIIPTCQPSPAMAQNLKASFYTVQSLKRDGQWKITKGVMANGKLFKDEGFTAASWDFPLNSMVKITNLKNPNKKIKVKITDRTARRFKGKRIDISRAAMEALGGEQSLKKGLLDVIVERIK